MSEVSNTVLCYEQLIKGYVCWGVKSGVCGFYTTLHTEYCYSCQRYQRCVVLCIQWPLTPARREGYLLQYSI